MSQVWVVRGSIMPGPLKHLKEIVTCRRYMRFGFWSTRFLSEIIDNVTSKCSDLDFDLLFYVKIDQNWIRIVCHVIINFGESGGSKSNRYAYTSSDYLLQIPKLIKTIPRGLRLASQAQNWPNPKNKPLNSIEKF